MVALLDSLATVAEDQMTSTFIERMDSVFASSHEDIRVALQRCSKESLGKLHKALCAQASTAFPELRGKQSINRQVINTLVGDIIALGYSICNQSLHPDAEKVFRVRPREPLSSNTSEQVTEVTPVSEEYAELLKVVATLSNRVSTLERELADLRSSGSNEEDAGTSSRTVLKLVHSGATDDPEETSSDDGPSGPWQPGVSQRSRRKKNKNKRKRSTRDGAATTAEATAADPPAPPTASASAAPSTQVPAPAPTLRAASTSSAQDRGESGITSRPLQAAAPIDSDSIDVYVGGVSSSNNASDIEAHLLTLGISQPRVKMLRETPSWKSFKVTVPLVKKSAVLDLNNWPVNLRVRLFRPRRFDQSTGGWGEREPSGRHRTPRDYKRSRTYRRSDSSQWRERHY